MNDSKTSSPIMQILERFVFSTAWVCGEWWPTDTPGTVCSISGVLYYLLSVQRVPLRKTRVETYRIQKKRAGIRRTAGYKRRGNRAGKAGL